MNGCIPINFKIRVYENREYLQFKKKRRMRKETILKVTEVKSKCTRKALADYTKLQSHKQIRS